MRTLANLAPCFALAALFAAPAKADHQAEVDRLVQPLLENKLIAGCVIGVIDGDQREIHAYGEVAVGGGQEPTGATIYEIGSVTKAFTGTLLGDMIERGEVKLDQPIAELCPKGVTPPEFAADQPITLMHLASHTSGLPRLPDNMAPKDPMNPYADYTPKLMAEFLNKHKLRRAPGVYEYSNYGAGLLGALLARRAGKTYEALIVERIADPLEMADTRIKLTKEQQARLAPAYNSALIPMKQWDFDALKACGALHSTADDLLKLLAAALSGADEPVPRALRLAGEKRTGNPGETSVGLGWHLAHDNVTRWHNGQTFGHSAYIAYFPDRRLAVAVVSNTATDLITTLGERVLQAALGMNVEPVGVRTEVAVDPAVLESYAGDYQLAPGFVLTITLEDGKLMAQATGQGKLEVFATSPTEFFYKAVDAQLTFEVARDGTVERIVLHQGGADVPGPRVGAAPVGKRTEVAVDPAVLENYVGEYQLAPGFVLTITLEDGQLTAQATGQGKNPIFASSPTEFFLKAVDAQITFDVTDDGKVERLVLHQGGAELPGPRMDVAK